MIRKTALVLLATVLAGCQTVEHIMNNMEELSAFQLPRDVTMSLQGQMLNSGGNYSLGGLSSTRTIERVGDDFWGLFFQALAHLNREANDHSKSVKYLVKDTIAADGTPAYLLTTEYSISFDKDGNDISSGLGDLSLKRLSDSRSVALRRTQQLGTEDLLEIDLPKKIKVAYYFNDLKREGGWADVLRTPTGVTIKQGHEYVAVLNCRYGGELYTADMPPETVQPRTLALFVAGIVFDTDKVKNQLAERARFE
jgi:hypothetical protein